MAIYDHACIREMVFIALLEGIQIAKLLFDESREEQARLQENIQLAVYLQMNEFQTALLIDPKMISFFGDTIWRECVCSRFPILVGE